ncbi:MAG: hypothetical protein HC818_01305 [Synechococcaceae cyanobacterium RM1_1_27]|nr:hypothetical protein [Synechococcaceae cyanobacterium RM1_1_27]
MIWPLRFRIQTLGSWLIGILGSVALNVGDPVWSQAVRIEIPVQEQTYSQLVEQARPLVWQQMAQQFGSDPERPFAMVEVFGKRGSSSPAIIGQNQPRDLGNPAPSQPDGKPYSILFECAVAVVSPHPGSH